MNKTTRISNLLVATAGLFLGAIALLSLATARLAKPLWALDRKTLLVLALIAAGYCLVYLWLLREQRRGSEASLGRILVGGCVAAVPVLLAVLLVHPDFSKTVLVVAPLLALGLLTFVFRVKWRDHLQLAVVGLAALAGVFLQTMLATRMTDDSLPTRIVTNLVSSMYELQVVSYKNYFKRPDSNQGGITLFGDRYLLTTGDGELFVFSRDDASGEFAVERLPYTVPLNRGEFAAASGETVNHGWFRVADVLAQETEGAVRVFVTHHFWNEPERCWLWKVSALEGRLDDFVADSAPLRWRTVFESRPCMPLALEGEPARFSGINNGGRMVLLDRDHLLVTVGDHEMDGYSTPVQASQDPSSSFGKTVLIDLRDGSSANYTVGHRNPQGLLLSRSGDVWSTEHGPEGGDELNLVRQGMNYGWPLVTFGAEYGTHSWPLSATPGRHEGFEQPVFSWVPSIGVSNLIEITSPRFDRWQGDLLVGSLRGQSLWRLRVAENRVVLAEQIPFGERIRDLQQGHDGEVVVWTDRETLHFISPSEATETGESLYRVCAGCHVAPAGQTSAVGPNLQGVVGRDIASAPGFDYSSALRTVEGKWTQERLDQFLADPRSVAPGTSMQFTGMKDPASRKILIEFMAAPGNRLDVAPPVPL